jgi:hypothetical protein
LLGASAKRHRNVPLDPHRADAAARRSDRGELGGGSGGGSGSLPVAAAAHRLEQRPRLVALFATPHPPRRCAFVEGSSGDDDDGRGLRSGNGASSSQSVRSGELYSTATAQRDLAAVAAAQAQHEYLSWLGLDVASATEAEAAAAGLATASRRDAAASHAAGLPWPPHPEAQSPLATQLSPALTQGLELALNGDLFDNFGAFFGAGPLADHPPPKVNSFSSNSSSSSSSSSSSGGGSGAGVHASSGGGPLAAMAGGWQVRPVEEWAIEAAVTPEVPAANPLSCARYNTSLLHLRFISPDILFLPSTSALQ